MSGLEWQYFAVTSANATSPTTIHHQVSSLDVVINKGFAYPGDKPRLCELGMPSRGEVYSTETRRPSIHPLLELLVGASVQSIRASWVCRVGAKFTRPRPNGLLFTRYSSFWSVRLFSQSGRVGFEATVTMWKIGRRQSGYPCLESNSVVLARGRIGFTRLIE